MYKFINNFNQTLDYLLLKACLPLVVLAEREAAFLHEVRVNYMKSFFDLFKFYQK